MTLQTNNEPRPQRSILETVAALFRSRRILFTFIALAVYVVLTLTTLDPVLVSNLATVFAVAILVLFFGLTAEDAIRIWGEYRMPPNLQDAVREVILAIFDGLDELEDDEDGDGEVPAVG